MKRFDRVAARYDAFCRTPLGRFVDEVERALLWELLRPKPGETIGDFGCGTGAYAAALAQAGCEVVGIDESPAMLAEARDKSPAMLAEAHGKSTAGGSISFLQADLADLPLRPSTLDAVLLQVTLEFVPDPAIVLNEAFRVLKTDGRLVLGLISGDGPWAGHYRKRAARGPESIYGHAHFFTLEEIHDLLGTAPTAVRRGLFVAPDEFDTVESAWILERRRSKTESGTAAGYLAVRYDLQSKVTPWIRGFHRAEIDEHPEGI